MTFDIEGFEIVSTGAEGLSLFESENVAYSAMEGAAIDTTKRINTKSISSATTFTFSGSPSTGLRTSLLLTTGASDLLVTLPAFWCRNRQEMVTVVTCFESSTYFFEFEYTGSRWESDSYKLALLDYDNSTLAIGHRIGLNAGGTASLFVGTSIGVGTRQGVTVGDGEHMSAVTDSVFVGIGAGECVISGNGQVAVGRLALGHCRVGQNNTALGDTALSRTLGDANVGVGYQSGTGNVNGESNVFVGHYSGGVDRDKGNFNICIGSYAGDGLLGNDNTFLGRTCGPGNSAGSATCNLNIGIGFEALNSLTTGDNNIALGDQSGLALTSGNSNIFIGDRSGADGQKVDAVNTICIGNGTQSTADNQMVLGGTDITKTLIRGTSIELQGFVKAVSIETNPDYGMTLRGVMSINDATTTFGYIFPNATALLKTYVSASPTATSTAPRQLYKFESRALLTNTGCTQECRLLLDNGAAGDCYEFVCTDADGIRIKCNGTDTIRDGASVSAQGGYIRSNVVGSAISLKCVATGLWFVLYKSGTWTIDS